MPRSRRSSSWQPSALGGDLGRTIGSQRLLGATFLIAVSLATIGQTRGGLPPPRRYAAVALLWFIFGLVAELGGQVARFVGVLASLVVLAMAMGTAGVRALAWLGGQAAELTERPTAAAEVPGAAGFGGPFTGGRTVTPSGGGGGGGFGGAPSRPRR